MKKNDNINVGDNIWISANTEKPKGYPPAVSYTSIEVEVGGIIRYFPDKGLWPFSETNQSYAVIGSPELMRKIYTAFGTSYKKLDKKAISLMNQTYAKVKLGRTVLYLYCDSDADFTSLERRLKQISDSLGGYVTNFREDNQRLLSEARNNTAIQALLCIVSAALGTIILYNSLSSRAEQDKKRTGILQAIGVTKRQLKRTQLSKGLWNAAISIIASHIILTSILFILFRTRAQFAGLNISVYFNKLIDYYPFYVHMAIIIIYFIITIIIYTLPTRRIIKNSPVENING